MAASLFDSDRAEDERDAGIATAEQGASDRWLAQALAAVRVIAARGEPFSTDDVWALLATMGAAVREPRAMGAVMRRARQLGICEPTGGFEKSVRPEHHRGPVRIWVSPTAGR